MYRMNVSNIAFVADYRVAVTGVATPGKGVLSIFNAKDKEILCLNGLSLRFTTQAQSEFLEVTQNLARHALIRFGKEDLLVDRDSMALSLWRNSFSKPLTREATQALDTVFKGQKVAPTLNLSLPTPEKDSPFSLKKGGVQCFLKKHCSQIEAALSWSDHLVVRSPENTCSLSFLRGGDGQISFTAAGKRVDEADEFQLFGLGEEKGRGFCSFSIENQIIELSSLSIWREQEVEEFWPEKLLSGCIDFHFKGELLFLSAESLIESIDAAAQGSVEKKLLIEKGLRDLGIVKHEITPLLIDEEKMRGVLEKEGGSPTDIEKCIDFLHTYHDVLTERLGWVSDTRMVKECKRETLPYTIRGFTDRRGREVLELTLKKMGSGCDKIVKKTIAITSRRMKIAVRKRTRTKERDGSRRLRLEIEASEQRMLDENDFIDRLIKKNIPFLLSSEGIVRLTHRGRVSQMMSARKPIDLFGHLNRIPKVVFSQQGDLVKMLMPTMCCLLLALEKLHRNKIFHLDFKVDNVLLAGNFSPSLIDFGSSKDLSDGTTLTDEDTLGTIGYLPPEAFFEGLVTLPGAVDMFAFGVALYAVVRGELPFYGVQRQYEEGCHTWTEDEFERWGNAFKNEIQSQQFFLHQLECDEKDPLLKSVYSLIGDLFHIDPAKRPTAKESLSRLSSALGPYAKRFEEMVESEEVRMNVRRTRVRK
jgi:hypothetical protein